MISFKGILKYTIYTFIAAWMFLLGIMVGRGTSPVKFDTQKFQKRLETIASEFGEKKDTQEKIDLKFYKVLHQPVPEEASASKKAGLEIIPKKEKRPEADAIPTKISKKKQTFKKTAAKDSTAVPAKETVKTNHKKSSGTISKSETLKKKSSTEQPAQTQAAKGRYTLQVAAYKAFKDAVTQMALLEKKGISSYREKGEKDGVTWYRIRTGSFGTYDEAKKYKEKLKKMKINSLIIKKDSNEDIKG